MGAATALGVAVANRRWARADRMGDESRYVLEGADRTTVRTRDGAELAVASIGTADGPTVVLAHCWTGDHRIWAPVAKRLAVSHRVVLFDQRGHGRSTIGTNGLTIDALGDDLCDLLEAMDLRDVVVAGHSMGGMASQAFVINHPIVAKKRLSGLALVATACDELETSPYGRAVAPSVGLVATTKLLERRGLGPVLVRGTVGHRPSLVDLLIVAETFAATAPSTRAALLDEMRVMDLSDGLRSIDLPVVVVAGTRDLLTPMARNERIADLVDDARLEVLPGLGHMLPCEAPDRVAEIIGELVQHHENDPNWLRIRDRSVPDSQPEPVLSRSMP